MRLLAVLTVLVVVAVLVAVVHSEIQRRRRADAKTPWTMYSRPDIHTWEWTVGVERRTAADRVLETRELARLRRGYSMLDRNTAEQDAYEVAEEWNTAR